MALVLGDRGFGFEGRGFGFDFDGRDFGFGFGVWLWLYYRPAAVYHRRRLHRSLGKTTGNHRNNSYSQDGVLAKFLANPSLNFSNASSEGPGAKVTGRARAGSASSNSAMSFSCISLWY